MTAEDLRKMNDDQLLEVIDRATIDNGFLNELREIINDNPDIEDEFRRIGENQKSLTKSEISEIISELEDMKDNGVEDLEVLIDKFKQYI